MTPIEENLKEAFLLGIKNAEYVQYGDKTKTFTDRARQVLMPLIRDIKGRVKMEANLNKVQEGKFLSLYDYLGFPARSALGKQVAGIAKNLGETIRTRTVENTKYSGRVMLYRESFLEKIITKNGVIR